MISTTEIPARDIAAKTRAAIPIIPFIPGPETLNIAILFRFEIPFTGSSSSSTLAPISVPGACGFPVFLIRHGIWNWAMGVMVRG